MLFEIFLENIQITEAPFSLFSWLLCLFCFFVLSKNININKYNYDIFLSLTLSPFDMGDPDR